MFDNPRNCISCKNKNSVEKFNKKLGILLNLRINFKICCEILEYFSPMIYKCNGCNNDLCKDHGELALARGQYYIGYGAMLCDNCDWNFIM